MIYAYDPFMAASLPYLVAAIKRILRNDLACVNRASVGDSSPLLAVLRPSCGGSSLSSIFPRTAIPPRGPRSHSYLVAISEGLIFLSADAWRDSPFEDAAHCSLRRVAICLAYQCLPAFVETETERKR
jgi:hypothetical protein